MSKLKLMFPQILLRCLFMVCPKCQSAALSTIPAEVRLYRNSPRTLSHPPMTPSPDILVCLDCGWSEFSIPRSWLSAGWLAGMRPAPEPENIATSAVAAAIT
jgi:hypothetical protein